jgi:division protein CdvB (Snf7/Vps24/ESCRT-III family)
MSSFQNRWTGPPKGGGGGIFGRIRDAVKREPPLKERLNSAASVLRKTIYHLDQLAQRLLQRDRELFNRMVRALRKGERDRANVLANELVQIRNMTKTTTQCKIALEQVLLRMETVKDMGDMVTSLAAATAVIRGVNATVAKVTPTADASLQELGSLLDGLLIEAGQTGGFALNFEAANEDARRILAEAAAVAEERLKGSLPEPPVELVKQGYGQLLGT